MGDHELMRPLLSLWESGRGAAGYPDWRERLLRSRRVDPRVCGMGDAPRR